MKPEPLPLTSCDRCRGAFREPAGCLTSMFTTDGLTFSAAPITALEYESSGSDDCGLRISDCSDCGFRISDCSNFQGPQFFHPPSPFRQREWHRLAVPLFFPSIFLLLRISCR